MNAKTATQLVTTRMRLFFWGPMLLGFGSLIAASVAILLVYDTCYQHQKARLEEAVKSEAQLVEVIAQLNDFQPEKTLQQLMNVPERCRCIGETGECTVAMLAGNEIRFLRHRRQDPHPTPESVPFDGRLAEPMRRALKGQTGADVLPDYKATAVLAAYRPIASLGWGSVAKMDLSEIRAPFVNAAVAVLCTIGVLVVGGTGLSIWLGKPMITELQRSEQRYRLLVETTSDFVWEVDQNGVFTYANPRVKDLLGYEPKEVIGWRPSDFMPREEAERIAGLTRDSTESGEPFAGLEVTHLHKDGRPVIVESSGVPIVDENGNHLGCRGIDRDITQRKQAEERMRQVNRLKEDLLRPGTLQEKASRITHWVVQILDADFVRIWITKPGDRCESGCFHAAVSNGSHVCRRRNRCLHLVASSGRYTHIDGEVHRRVPLGCYKIGRVASGEEAGFLTNHVTRDPRVHDHQWARKLGLVSFAGYRLLSTEGKPIGVLALFSQHPLGPDEAALLETLAATAAQAVQTAKAEEALRFTQFAVDQAAESAAWIGPDARFLYVNDKFCRSLGYSREELLSMTVHDVDPNFPKQRWPARWQELKREGSLTFESCHRSKHGTVFPVEITVKYLEYDGKEYHCTFVRDVRERKEAEAALRKVRDELETRVRKRTEELSRVNQNLREEIAERRRAQQQEARLQAELAHMGRLTTMGEMASGLAHELNQPLAAIAMFARAAAREVPPGKEESSRLAKICDDIAEQALRAGQLVRRMRQFVKKIEPQKTDLDFRHLLEEIVSLIENDLGSAGIAIRIDVAESLPAVRADRIQVEQVLLNLIRNALEAMQCTESDAHELRIEAKLRNRQLEIAVRDTGVGVPEDQIDDLFGTFYSTKPEGMGMGLPISRSIVEAHGGRILAMPNAGRGATFTFTLPIAGAPEGLPG